MGQVTIARQFRGPPQSGNGGYVAGMLGRRFDGPSTAIIRAPVPLDIALLVEAREAGYAMLDGETMVMEARAASAADLPETPIPPGLEQARAAGARSPALDKPFHPTCFSCSVARAEGDGLRICNGQIEGAAPGYSACVWTPHANFADADGLISTEVIWAALDCSGAICWSITGSPPGLLGTMTGEVVRRPRADEETIVMAWPIGVDGRKYFSGVALFDAHGALLARGRQIWIGRTPRPAQ